MPAQDQAPTQRHATSRNNKKKEHDALHRYLFPDQQLSEKQLLAIDLMLHGLSDAHVAAQLGADRTTVFRWRKSEVFARELDHHRRTLIQQSTTRLQALLGPALDILQKQLAGDDPKTQLRAAAILVRLATPSRLQCVSATADLAADARSAEDEQIDRLEAYINAPMPGRTSLDDLDDDLPDV